MQLTSGEIPGHYATADAIVHDQVDGKILDKKFGAAF